MRLSSSKALLGILLVSTIVLGGFPICAAAETTVEEIMNKGDSYDGRTVSVMGTVSNLKFGSLEVGNNYTTFMLASKSGGRVKVFARGKLTLKAGQKVQVTGVYRKVSKAGPRYFYNQIVASEVK
jgi:hypothetical protein